MMMNRGDFLAMTTSKLEILQQSKSRNGMELQLIILTTQAQFWSARTAPCYYGQTVPSDTHPQSQGDHVLELVHSR